MEAFDKIKDFHLILASASPRRRDLLKQMGLEFDVIPRKVIEAFPPSYSPENVAIHLAELKASAFENSELHPNKILITSDTVVAVDGKILAKPISRINAVESLKCLSGKAHNVITAVCLKSHNKKKTFACSTRVYFKELTNWEIDYYISNYMPFDKAGAYGIQEWIGHVAIEKIEGSYFNVMGLPTHRLYEELLKFVSEINILKDYISKNFKN